MSGETDPRKGKRIAVAKATRLTDHGNKETMKDFGGRSGTETRGGGVRLDPRPWGGSTGSTDQEQRGQCWV